MFKIVFRDSSFYLKQLSLFCLLRLISASADRIDYINNLYSMIELFLELKNSSFYIEALLECSYSTRLYSAASFRSCKLL